MIATVALTVACTSASGTACSDHTPSDWIVDKEASCSAEGARHTECTVCGETLESESIAKLAHTEAILESRDPSCAEEGLTEGKHCSVCGEIIVAQNKIDKLTVHTEKILELKNPTCTESGLTQGKSCTVCNTVLVAQETIPALGHYKSNWIIDTAADVGVSGSKHTECVRCGEKYETETIPAITEDHVHEGAEWLTVIYPSCSTEGVKSHICSCGAVVESEELEKLAHTETDLLEKAATCTEEGLTAGKQCVICGTVTVSQTPLAKSSHVVLNVTGKAATCTERGTSDSKKCAVCSAPITTALSTPPTGHSFADGACVSCGIAESYGAWIVDGLGNPVSNIIIKVMKDGEMVKMYPYKGEYLTFDIEDGEYTLELDLAQTGASYSFDTEQCKLSPDKKTATINLYNTVFDPISVFVGEPISKDYGAYHVSEGSYQVTLTPNDYNFFVFVPTSAAIYTITYECDSDLAVSYHGSTFFVQGVDLTGGSSDSWILDNGIAISVYQGNLGGNIVFAIKGESATSCTVNIQYAGDPGTRIEDLPWTPYLEDAGKVQEHLSISPEGEYKLIDLTDLTLSAVYNTEDGFYHLNSADGPIIFIDLTSDTQYIGSIQTICSLQRIGTYIYDANGVVIDKRSYNELFIQYGMPNVGETELTEPLRVPLTEKLAEAIKVFGEDNGWWSATATSNIFTNALLGTPYNREYAWLLYCGYYE